MTDRRLELSRRKILAGVGTIGVASAGAGLGTSAFLSDTEEFTGNQITAGELDLWVAASTTYNGGPATNDATDVGLTDGSDLPAAFYDLGDVKPGDSGTATICFDVVDNPAWVWAQGIVTANDENGQNEPEMDVDSTTGEGNGELAGALDSTLFVDDDGDGEHDSGEDVVFGDLFAGHFSPWQLIGEFDASAQPETDEDLDHCITLDWELPSSVGNEVQSDQLEFFVALYAEQARHNDQYTTQDVCYSSPDNPTADGPAGSQPNFSTNQVFELCIDYSASGGELDEVVYNIELAEPWSDPGQQHANVGIGFCGTMDGDGASLPLDPIADYQITWSSGDGFRYSPVVEDSNPTVPYTGTGTPVWQYSTSEGWQSLPSGITASKSGTSITITGTVDDGFPYDPGDIHGIVGNASYGGATHANISADPANAWSSDNQWTSTEYFLPTKIPDSV